MTMTLKERLADMITKVEVGDIEGTRPWAMLFGLRADNRHLMAWGAYNGSLDAAKALHEVALPNDRARLDIGRRYRAWTISPQNHKTDAYADTPARAWLLAILKALSAKEGKP